MKIIYVRLIEKALDINLLKIKEYHGVNFDLYRSLLLRIPLHNLIKQDIIDAHLIKDIERLIEKLIIERKNRAEFQREIEKLLSILEEEKREKSDTERNKFLRLKNEIKQRQDKELLERILAELRQIREIAEKELEELRAKIRKMHVIIFANSDDILKAIDKNDENLLDIKDRLHQITSNIDSPLKEAIMEDFQQYKNRVDQAPAKYLQWLNEKSSNDAEKLIENDKKEIIEIQESILANMQKLPNNESYIQEINQKTSEIMLNLEVVVAKGINNIKCHKKIEKYQDKFYKKRDEVEQHILNIDNYREKSEKIKQAKENYIEQTKFNLLDSEKLSEQVVATKMKQLQEDNTIHEVSKEEQKQSSSIPKPSTDRQALTRTSNSNSPVDEDDKNSCDNMPSP